MLVYLSVGSTQLTYLKQCMKDRSVLGGIWKTDILLQKECLPERTNVFHTQISGYRFAILVLNGFCANWSPKSRSGRVKLVYFQKDSYSEASALRFMSFFSRSKEVWRAKRLAVASTKSDFIRMPGYTTGTGKA